MHYQRLYDYRFRKVSQARRNDVWEAVAPMLYEWLKCPDRVLDPAAGRCEFINAVPSAERWAVDAVAYEEVEAQDGIQLIVSGIMEADLPREYFEGIFVSNFLSICRPRRRSPVFSSGCMTA